MGQKGYSANKLPDCGYTLDGQACNARGQHYCIPRALRVERFYAEALVHTKGRFARKPFILAPWQRDELVHPLFGSATWSDEWECYKRLFTLGWIEIARKNGKSEFDAGAALLLTCADDEESAEVYGMALDIPQAKKVFEVAVRMVELSPVLSKRLIVKESARRIIDPRTNSYYEVVPADAAGNLGHNPHGGVLDEALTQPSGDLWSALRTAAGTRVQPLFIATTTAGNDPASWAAQQSAEATKIAADPKRSPHTFVFQRNTPKDADPWDESNWAYANPGLGDFLSISSLREEALDARSDPAKENAFRQFRLNQWVQQVTRWMPLHLWDSTAGLVVEENLKGRRAFGGLDLASTTDLASLCWVFPDGDSVEALWRYWTPAAQIPFLDQHTGGMASVWVKQGFLTATDGDVIDHESIKHQIDLDCQAFDVVDIGHDRWGATAIVQWMQERDIRTFPLSQGFALSPALQELMRLVKLGRFNHGGNPVSRWNADSVEVKQDHNENIRIVKPERKRSGKRIDGIASASMALDGWMRRNSEPVHKVAEFYSF